VSHQHPAKIAFVKNKLFTFLLAFISCTGGFILTFLYVLVGSIYLSNSWWCRLAPSSFCLTLWSFLILLST
jgi:hypothetical protein